MKIKATLLCLLLLVSGLPIAAQVSEREKQEKEAEQKKTVERKTCALVDEIATGALSLKLPENRSYVLAAAADLLWDHDQPHARNLFWDAINTLSLMNTGAAKSQSGQSSKGDKASPKEREQLVNEYIELFGARQELLQRISRRDPQFALDVLRGTRQSLVEVPAEWTNQGYSLPDDRFLEQEIATEVAARDPQKGLELARESLAKGLSFQLLEFLNRLSVQDADLATTFAGEIIAKLSSRNIATDLQSSQLAISLLSMSRKPKGDSPVLVATASPFRPLELPQEQRRELVEMLTNAALTESANSNLLYSLSSLMPEIREFAPERVAAIERKLASFDHTLNKEQRLWRDFGALFRKDSPEEILKFASMAGSAQPEMEHQAIELAVIRQHADSLREYINTEIADDSRQKKLLDVLDTEQVNFATEKGDGQALQELLPRIRRPEQRARAMSAIAITLEKRGDHDEALKLLDEAQTLVKTDFDSQTQTNALLALAGAYALVEPSRAFVIIERSVDHANDDMRKLLLLDKIFRSGLMKKGELKMRQMSAFSIDYSVFKYGKSITALADADFDRTRAAADRFERNEFRLMGRLLLAQALLRKDTEAANGPTRFGPSLK